MTSEKLIIQIEKKTQKTEGFYAELEVVVFSLEGEQSYQVKQWQDSSLRWRVEVAAAQESQHFICDGEQIWVYQPGLDDYYRIDADRGSLELAPPFMLTGYLAQLQQADSYTFNEEEDPSGHQIYNVTYAGRIPGETICLSLDQKTLFPRLVQTYLNEEPLNRITVKKLELNPTFEPNLFEFTAAAETEVTTQCLRKPLTLTEARENWPIPIFLPTYVPTGSSLFVISRSVEQEREQLILIYQGPKSFTLVQHPNAEVTIYRSATSSDVQIGQHTGLYQQNSDYSLATLWWSNEQSNFILTGSLPLQEMVKIARSLVPDGV
ncbi:MAG: DUF4367 domain-containing protein [Firmicutes bacterium]|nr:DUF4367 domain-containing protein [Bacillota bacterium]